MIIRRRIGCWGQLLAVLISMLALFALAFAFQLEIRSPYFTMRFGPQWPQGVELSSSPGGASGASGAAATGAGSADLGGLPKGQAAGNGLQIGVEAGGLGAGVGLGEGGLQVGAEAAGVGGASLELGGNGVQAGAEAAGVGVDAGVGGGSGVQVGVDTGLGVGVGVGVDPNEGVNVGLDLPGENLDSGVNLGSGGCSVVLLGQCIVP